MNIQRFYDRTAITQRQDFVVGSTIKKEYVSKLTSFPCHVQPIADSLAVALPGSFGKTWIMFCPVDDIDEGDKVLVGTDEYRVVGVKTFDMSADPHLEVTIRAFRE